MQRPTPVGSSAMPADTGDDGCYPRLSMYGKVGTRQHPLSKDRGDARLLSDTKGFGLLRLLSKKECQAGRCHPTLVGQTPGCTR